MQLIKPLDRKNAIHRFKVFLAGTIDNGNSEDWQTLCYEHFANKSITLYNPRRDSWNSSLDTTINSKDLVEQVEWELNALRDSSVILMNLLPDSKSPISLLELGLFAKDTKLVVVCPDKFYRSGNVKVVCRQYGIPVFDTIEEGIEFTLKLYEQITKYRKI